MSVIKNLFYGAIGFLLECLVIMLLWNAVLPDLIGVSAINYGQTMAIKIICNLLISKIKSYDYENDEE